MTDEDLDAAGLVGSVIRERDKAGAERDHYRDLAAFLELARDEEHGWAVIATERAQRVEAERDALQALINDLREACGHGPTGGITLDLFARLDAAAKANHADS
jgi:hypothetical protein